MNRCTISMAALALLAGAAVAQTSPSPQSGQAGTSGTTNAPATTGSTSATNQITPQEETAIKGQITKDAQPSSAAPSGFTAAEGATLPQAVVIHEIPAEVAGGPGLSYATIGNKAVVVDPQRKVVAIIEMK
jgi:hypothetical protein